VATGGDLRDPATAKRLVDEVEAELGPVDILISNAGIGSPPRRLEEIELEEFNALIEVNLRAPFLLAQRVLPGMTERGFGRIVFLSSVAAYTGGVIGAHYASSKAGLHGLTHSISQQAAGAGVTANVIAPALVESDMLPSDPEAREALAARLPVGRLGRPEEVADLIAAVVANAYLTNQSILLDGGWHPH
jgi:3-oxoacyl-[acyl-carrier protein] reductase